MVFSGDDELLKSAGMRDFGDYELLEEIARGGMGVVYRARQRSLQRDVALKMILAGELAGSAARRMFETEALAAAALHHPNIVPVYDSGEQDLQPFIAMRFVPGGKTIAHWAAEERARGNWRAIAGAAALVARAVAHAHERGVLHRDLKPSNILWDSDAGPQVTDFGLAKLISGSPEAMTVSLRMLGSPGYMAPEQAGAKDSEITTLTDVYGLGAVLYELLSGRPPFSGRSALETARMVTEQSPAPLRNVPRDLATVCQKCLSRLPGDRYSQAAGVAEELERFVRGEPVLAMRLAALPRLWRWSRRRPAVASLLVLLAAALVSGISGVVWQWRKAETARQLQAAALQTAEEANAAQSAAIRHLRWQEMDNHLNRGEAARALARAAAFLREDPDDWRAAMMGMSIVDRNSFPLLAAPEITTLTGKGLAARMSLDGRWIVHAAADYTVKVFDSGTGRQVASFSQFGTPRPTDDKPAAPRELTAIATGAGRYPLAVGTDDGRLTLRTLPEGSEAVVLHESQRASAWWELLFSADGSRLMGRTSSAVFVWNLADSGTEPVQITFTGGFIGAALSSDGKTVAGWNSARAAVWSTTDGGMIMQLASGQPPSQVALSADGRVAALADATERIKVWDITKQTVLPDAGRYHGEFAALNADGTRLLTGGSGCSIAVHDTASGMPVAQNLWPHKTVMHFNVRYPFPAPWLSVSADGGTFASTGIDNTVNLWDSVSGQPLCSPQILGPGPDFATVHLAPDAKQWLTHSRVFRSGTPVEAKLAVWKRSRTAEPVRTLVEDTTVSAAVVSPDGRFAAASRYGEEGKRDGGITVTDIATGKPVIEERTHNFARVMMFSPDSRRVYTLSGTIPPELTAWSLDSRGQLWSIPAGPGSSTAADVSPDGTVIAAAYNIPGKKESGILLVNAADGSVNFRLPLNSMTNIVRFAPDMSGRLMTGGSGSAAQLWDARKGSQILTFPADANAPFNAASWSPDAGRLAVASESTVRVWDGHTGRDTGVRFTAGASIAHLVFSPDGRLIATTSRDGTHCVWDAASGLPLWPARRQGASGESIHFLPDGAIFVVQDTGGFRYWSTAGGEPVSAYYPAPWAGVGTVDCPGYRAVLTPDGARVFTGSLARETALWTVPLPRGKAPRWLPEFFEALAMMKENADSTTSFVHGRALREVQEMMAGAAAEEPFAAWARRVLGN